jgi:hypothetical protein
MAKIKTLSSVKKTYLFETKNKSIDFKLGWLEGALASTNNQKIREWLQTEIYKILRWK